MSQFKIISNPDPEGKPFRLQEVATGRLSVEAFYTRRSATHAAKKEVKLV